MVLFDLFKGGNTLFIMDHHRSFTSDHYNHFWEVIHCWYFRTYVNVIAHTFIIFINFYIVLQSLFPYRSRLLLLKCFCPLPKPLLLLLLLSDLTLYSKWIAFAYVYCTHILNIIIKCHYIDCHIKKFKSGDQTLRFYSLQISTASVTEKPMIVIPVETKKNRIHKLVGISVYI